MRDAEPRLSDSLRQLPVGERPRVLSRVLRDRISEALGIDPSDVAPRDRLMDLGVNSMKAVELKIEFERELELSLSSSVLFDCPTVESLTAFLLEQLDPGQDRMTRGREPEPVVAAASGIILGEVAEGRPSVDGAAKSVAELLAEELADLRRRQRPF
jgi:acyl carrier protein